jgi:hypothetical protein
VTSEAVGVSGVWWFALQWLGTRLLEGSGSQALDLQVLLISVEITRDC